MLELSVQQCKAFYGGTKEGHHALRSHCHEQPGSYAVHTAEAPEASVGTGKLAAEACYVQEGGGQGKLWGGSEENYRWDLGITSVQ